MALFLDTQTKGVSIAKTMAEEGYFNQEYYSRENDAPKTPGQEFLEEIENRLRYQLRFSSSRGDDLRAPFRVTPVMGKINENKIWHLSEDDRRYGIFPIYEDRRTRKTVFGTIRLFFRNHLCFWVIPNRVSCWREAIVACQEEVSKQINEDALKQESENDKVKPCNGKSAEEIAKDDALDVDSFDEASGWRAVWIFVKDLCCICCTPSSCCVNRVAHSPEYISSIDLPPSCNTPSTSGRATLKVMESFLEEEREDVDDDDDEEKKKTVWQDSLAAVEEMHNMYNGKLTEQNVDDIGFRNGRISEEGMEEIDLHGGKLSESATEDKMEETEREKGKGKPKKAGRIKRIRQFFKRLCCCCCGSKED
uniref:Uncharacterized protein LOC111129555 n=1 Tax=Crassostrea virginica TaxID=6565 RepID=A0A8B8DVP6_CRAVI|nr:uncharacterized protein LOC111129555 [Crassostrea virginica]